MKKNFLSIILALVIFALTGSEAFAASSKVIATIHNFSSSTTISSSALSVMKSGKISAVKKEGKIYYKFTKDNQIVYVEANAFKATGGNNYSSLNSKLSQGLNTNSGSAYGQTHVIKKRSTSSQTVGYAGGGTKKRTISRTFLAKLETTSQRTANNVVLKTKVKSSVVFVYSNLVRTTINSASIRYKEPSTASEYCKALVRESAEKNNFRINPKFSIEVVKPGSAKVSLSNFKMAGKGICDKTIKPEKFIKLAFALGKMLEDGYAGKGLSTMKDLCDIGITLKEMEPENEEYKTREITALSKEGKKCAKASFQSPIEIGMTNDYFQIEIALSKTPSTAKGKVKTEFKVSFSV